MYKFKSLINGLAAVLFTAAISLPVLLPAKVKAAVPTNYSRVPKISFTFDDGFASARTLAGPTLAKYGMAGTAYVTTNCIGMVTIPNNCKADRDKAYMTWGQVNELQDNYGWEIGSHTHTHPFLADPDTSVQATPLTEAQVTQELTTSKSLIQANTGVAPTAFASPYGHYDLSGNPVLAEVAKLYTSHRGFADQGYNVSPWDIAATLPAENHPLNNFLIVNKPVQEGITVNMVKGYIDKAIADNAWLVLTLHEIKDGNADPNPDEYQYNNASLDTIAAYAKSKNMLATNVSDALSLMNGTGTNYFSNSSFDAMPGTYNSATLSKNEWTTDSPSTITRDTGNHGSFPGPTNSVKVTNSASATHLFSPVVNVDQTKGYIVNMFINIKALAAGKEVAFYIDEYNAAGAYLGTQYKQSILPTSTPLVKNWDFEYTPRAGAAQARLQVYFAASSGITAYLDNAEFFAKDGSGIIVTPPTTSPADRGDLNSDGVIDALDLSTLLTNWDKTGQTQVQGDVNKDGAIDALDLSTLLTNWSN